MEFLFYTEIASKDAGDSFLEAMLQLYKKRKKTLDCLVTGVSLFVKDTKVFEFLVYDCQQREHCIRHVLKAIWKVVRFEISNIQFTLLMPQSRLLLPALLPEFLPLAVLIPSLTVRHPV